MTDQVTEDVNTEATAKDATPEELSFPDEMSKLTFDTIVGLINDRNSQVGKINAVKGDRQTLSEQLTESSKNKAAVKARKTRDEAQEILDQAIMELHAAIQPEIDALLADAEGSAKQIEEDIKELDTKIKPAQNFFKKMYGEVLAKHLPPLAKLKGYSTKGVGASGRRVRGFNVTVVIDGQDTTFENMASAAKYLEVDTATLQDAFFKAAGDKPLKEIADRVDFEVNFTETHDDDSTEVKTAKVTAERQVKDEAPVEPEPEIAAQ